MHHALSHNIEKMTETPEKLESIILKTNKTLRDYGKLVQCNNELIAQNNKLLESMNDYLRKITINTSS